MFYRGHLTYYPHTFFFFAFVCTNINWAATLENRIFAYAKTKMQISFAVTAKLISAFVFATWIVQYLFFLNTKFQASSHLLWLHSLVCVGPGRKPQRPVFSQWGSIYTKKIYRPYPITSAKLSYFLQDGISEPRHKKTNNVVFDQVWHKPGCAATGDG